MEGREDIRRIVSRKTNFGRSRRGGRAGNRPRGLPPRARERLSSLLAERELAALRRALREKGTSGWIVGGALRDLVLGRDVPEVDVAVDGDAGELAASLDVRGRGRAVLLSGDRSPRVFRVAGHGRALDLAELEGGSIETDLERRDFTVNAMAADLVSGDLVDPFGGLADLSARRLRMVAEENLFEDPLRPLRAARLYATHGLAPDRATTRACRRASAALGRVAKERIQTEMAKLLEADRAAPALAWAATAGLLEPSVFPALSARRRTSITRVLAGIDANRVRRLPPPDRRRVRLALVAGRLGLSGAQVTASLRGTRYPAGEAVEVGRLLDLAGRARGLRRSDDVWPWLLQAGGRAPLVLLLLELLSPRLAPHVRWLSSAVSRAGPIPDVRGADVLEWLGIAPGREVGRLLDAVRVEGLAGRVRNRIEARKWLRASGLRAAGGRGAKSLSPDPI